MSDIPPPPPGDTPPPPPPPPPGPMGGPPPPPPGPMGVPRPAELTDRFLAKLIDWVGLGVVTGIIYAILAAIILSGASCRFDNDYNYSCGYGTGKVFLVWFIFAVLSVVIIGGYFVFMQSSQGATFGQQLMKLKVVGPDGVSNPTMEQAVRRNIYIGLYALWIVPVAGPFLGGLAMLGALIYIAVTINQDTVRRQGWHDKFAGGTSVLKVG